MQNSHPKARTATGGGTLRIYTLEVFLIGGPITERFAKKNPTISRTIQIRGDQTIHELHYAIFDAFGRREEHMYEFPVRQGTNGPEAPRYVLPSEFQT